MKASTTKNSTKKLCIFYSIILLIIWHFASVAIGQDILLVSPIDVCKRFFELCFLVEFWKSIWGSLIHITFGFLIAFCVGIILGIGGYLNKHVYCFILPIVSAVKATPVVSFIILALVYVNTSKLSVVISFLMVFPIIWTNVIKGLYSADEKLIEMSKVFSVPIVKRLRYIYLPAIFPILSSALSIGIGFAWKSGIAAEIIGLSKNTIGLSLYDAKLYLATADIFCYSIVVVAISVVSEKLIHYFMKFTFAKIR